jgi:small nuclear ribonucleoprotein (snRNP)-like protein
MNVVLDEAEEVWVKDTKTKKAGDRNTLGKLALFRFTPSRIFADDGESASIEQVDYY